jgi:phosphodiesterase/alkaline phosphatase D-like protein
VLVAGLLMGISGAVSADDDPATPPTVTTSAASSITQTSATLNGNLASLGSASPVTVRFEYGPTTAYGSITPDQSRNASGAFTANITSLAPATTYHYRAVAVGSSTVYGTDQTFTTDPQVTAPTVSTSAASAVTQTSATLNGNLTALGSASPVTVRFEYGPTTAYGSVTPDQSRTTTGVFNAGITGLTPATTYHYRAVAVGSSTVYGADQTFTTDAQVTAPAVSTSAASAVTQTSATLNGNLTALGSASPVTVSFEWGTTAAYGSDTPGQSLNAAGAFNAGITGLTPDTTYHYHAVAVGSSTVYGTDQSFTTGKPSTPPTVTTSAASAITQTSATLNGNLTSLGSASPVTVRFEWGTTDAYGSLTPNQSRNSTGTFNAGITGLTPATTYHYRAVAVGSSTVYGTNQTFTTGGPVTPPTVTASAASAITQTSATLNGDLTSLGSASSVTVRFEWGATTAYGSVTPDQSRNASGAFNAGITGLTPATTYHYRAVAVGSSTVYSIDRTFTTAALIPPSITTSAASAITQTSATLNGDLTSLGSASSVIVRFEWGATAAYGSVTPDQTRNASGAFNAGISGLTPSATYHYRAVAVGSSTVYGTDRTFTTAALIPPSITTSAASAITQTSATLNGDLTSLGSASSVIVRFEWGATAAYGSVTPDQTRNASGSFNAGITGLTPSATYHYRTVAVGSSTVYGTDRTFTTAALIPPSVTTSAAAAVTQNSATLNGDLTFLGSTPLVTVRFEWGTTTAYDSANPDQYRDAPGAFSAAITGLAPGTTYHYRAVATGGLTVYGNDQTFTTKLPDIPPAVTTSAAAAVTQTSAALNGNLTSLGSFLFVSVRFEWGTTDSYGYVTPEQSRNAAGAFTARITGLTPSTTYHYRAVAVGSSTVYGADQTFTTGAPTPPVVSTTQFTNITATSATLTGNLSSTGSATSVTVSFEWGTTTAYGNVTTGMIRTYAAIFTAGINGLQPGTTYHYRSKAVGSGTSYGDDMTFTTGVPGEVILIRVLPPATGYPGYVFPVTITFHSPADGFRATGFTDLVPSGWIISEPVISPTPLGQTISNNSLSCAWSAPGGAESYNKGTAFSVSYQVRIPAGNTPGSYDFRGELVYYIGDSGPFTKSVSGKQSITAVTKPPPPTAAFSLENLALSNSEIFYGEEIVVQIEVYNTGDADGLCEVKLNLAGNTVETRKVALKAGERETIIFGAVKPPPGSVVIDVNGIAASVAVRDSTPSTTPTPSGSANFPVVWVILGLAGLVVVLVVLRAARP